MIHVGIGLFVGCPNDLTRPEPTLENKMYAVFGKDRLCFPSMIIFSATRSSMDFVFFVKASGQGIYVKGDNSYSWSCLCYVNIWIVSIFVNSNPSRMINVSTFGNLNPIYLLFVLGRSI